jgi:hypothetical protein
MSEFTSKYSFVNDDSSEDENKQQKPASLFESNQDFSQMMNKPLSPKQSP